MYANKPLMGLFITCWLLAHSTTAIGASFSKAELRDEQFLLLDVKNKELLFLEAIDAYGLEGLNGQDAQILLPLAALLQALEMDFVVSTANATIKLTRGNVVFDIDLINQTQSGPLRDNTQPFFWSNEENELLVSHILIEQLIDAKLSFNPSLLVVTIDQAQGPFPVERRLEREKRRRNAIRTTQENPNADLNTIIFADEFILDTYQLASMPYVYNNFNFISNGDQNSDTNISNLLQSNFDLLYHNANLTLNKRGNNDIATNLTFKRHQASPYENFYLGIQHYSFGDVFGTADNLTGNSQEGIGLSVARRPVNFSRKFGSMTLEDFAPPGWEIELYRGGVLLISSTVPDDGRYVFEDVETLYGVNKFEIKLYGPHGQEEVHHKNIRINGTQLKQGEYGFDSYILDAGNKLLGGINGKAEAFNPDTFGFSWDYGLTENISMGFNLAQTKNNLNTDQQFIGADLQTSIPGALFDFALSHEVGQGYAALAAVSGRLWDTTTYQLNYATNNNYQQQDIKPDEDLFSASVNGRLFKINYNNLVAFNKNNQTQSLTATNRLSWRLGKLNITHVVNYRHTQSNITTAINSEILTGELSIAGRLGQDNRIAAGINYDMKDKAKINVFRLSTGIRLSEKINVNSQLDYRPLSSVKWRINNALSWSSPGATFYSSFAYDANDQWSVGLGLTFSLGYDEYKDDWLFDSQNITAGGTMDINSYLDQNNNQKLDEGDVALPGVRYGHLKQWEAISSNAEGKALLPFITSYRPTQISPSSTFGIVPSTKSYAVYTHPGSRIKAQIPFTVRTSVSGFVILDDEDGEPLINAKLVLSHIADKSVDHTTTDQDGYFEFNDIVPGDYRVTIDPETLDSRALQSDPGSVRFSTLPAGGFLELGVIAAVPLSRGGIVTMRETIATINNYEPLEKVERLLSLLDQPEVVVADEKSLSTAPVNYPLLPSSTVLKASKEQIKAIQNIQQLKHSAVLADPTTDFVFTNTTNMDEAITTQWALQFAIYSSQDRTEELLIQLQQMEISAVSVFDPQAKTYRVVAGPYPNKTQTSGLSKELNKLGFDNYLSAWPAKLDTADAAPNTPKIAAIIHTPDLPMSGYTIQLMVASNKNTLKQVIQTQLGGGIEYPDLYQIEKQYQGQPMYVLLKGHYVNRQLAEQDVRQLPDRFKGKTWIRAVTEIRAESMNKSK
ncbi:MAG: cell division septation protein DedD [Paraglaciecola sp.]|jgi:cell division septation protein DedD